MKNIIKIAEVDEAVITRMLRQGYSSGGVLETIDGVPENAKLLDVKFEKTTRRIMFYFSHPSFATEVGKLSPVIRLVMKVQQSRKKGKAG